MMSFTAVVLFALFGCGICFASNNILRSKTTFNNNPQNPSAAAVATPPTPDTDQLWYEKKLSSHETIVSTISRYHVLRLSPGEDLLESLWKYARVLNTKALTIVSCVGSLQKTNIRYANEESGTVLEDYFEIVSLVGNIDFQYQSSRLNKPPSHHQQQQTQSSVDTTSPQGPKKTSFAYPSSMGSKNGSGHVHISISDKTGQTVGGHLLSGNIIYTTAEITLVEMSDVIFRRELDDGIDGSGYYELTVYPDSSINDNDSASEQN